jgi:response regulator RpfG family c-di-GMP phosphodiesterase
MKSIHTKRSQLMQEITPKINVLYVDDERINLEGFKANYRRDYNVFTAVSASEALNLLGSNNIHVLITDQKMPDTQGTELLAMAAKVYPQQTRIMLTAYADTESILSAFHDGDIFRYVLKPYDPDKLKKTIDEAYEFYKLKKVKDELYQDWIRTQQELAQLMK